MSLIPQTTYVVPTGFAAITLYPETGNRLADLRALRIYHVRYGSALQCLDSAARQLSLAKTCTEACRWHLCGISDSVQKAARKERRRYAKGAVAETVFALIALRAGFLC